MERFISAPPIDVKVAIECENVSRAQFVCQLYQARIRQVDIVVTVLVDDTANLVGGFGQLKRNLKNTRGDIVKHSLAGCGHSLQQIARFCNHRLASDQGRPQPEDSLG